MNKVIHGDCLEKLKELEENSIDSIVTDPPYELGFMGKSWDSTGIANNKDMWAECLRVLKPGGHLLAFSGTRTYHRMASAIEDAGFEVRDMIEYVYGSGFPKSLNIQKHLLKKYGYGSIGEYETTQQKIKSQLQDVWKRILLQTEGQEKINRRNLSDLLEDLDKGTQHKIFTYPRSESKSVPFSERQRQSCMERWGDLPTPQGELYCKCQICSLPTGFFIDGKKRWVCYGTQTNNGKTSWEVIDENGVCSSYQSQSIGQSLGKFNVVCEQCDAQAIRGTGGFGTALKPAHEPICMARKPLAEKTVAQNVLEYGTGGINIDESRVGFVSESDLKSASFGSRTKNPMPGGGSTNGNDVWEKNIPANPSGRFPANLIHDNSEEVRECFPETKSVKGKNVQRKDCPNTAMSGRNYARFNEEEGYNDSGNASRFFKAIENNDRMVWLGTPEEEEEYNNLIAEMQDDQVFTEEQDKRYEELSKKSLVNKYYKYPKINRKYYKSIIYQAKSSKSDRNSNGAVKNIHPTCKPTKLMEYLIKMVTPKGGTVLDPFAGSGSTLVAAKQNGFQYIGIEMTEEYIPIINARLGL